jgi:16S rRNA (cytidine1402-2'-O)-methyltransferase
VPLAVCATPIGNLEDVTLRVLAELRDAEVVLCEDTRRTRILLDRHGIRARALVSYHRHNEAARVAELVPRLVAGVRVALVSDAGLPGVNDPGARLVTAALDAGVAVTVLPGASAVETALVASGLVGEQYRFVGYLPRRSSELEALWAELRGWPHPVVAFEAPGRLRASLASLAAAEPARPVAVCRELTKLHEEVVRGAAAEVVAAFETDPKGELAIVIGGAPDADADAGAAVFGQARAAVGQLVAGGASRRVAVDVVASLAGVRRRALYDASLVDAGSGGDEGSGSRARTGGQGP